MDDTGHTNGHIPTNTPPLGIRKKTVHGFVGWRTEFPFIFTKWVLYFAVDFLKSIFLTLRLNTCYETFLFNVHISDYLGSAFLILFLGLNCWSFWIQCLCPFLDSIKASVVWILNQFFPSIKCNVWFGYVRRGENSQNKSILVQVVWLGPEGCAWPES